MSQMQFIDLKSQYSALRVSINSRIQAVLDHGQYIMGPEVKELEKQLAAYAGVKHCITVSSGTEALLISLMSLDIGPGDEVITTPFTFAATVEVIRLVGATPVFVDIEPDTCNLDVKKLSAALTEHTKAIIPVSLYGQVADLSEINAIAQAHGNLPVIEDAAQSFGAVYKDKKSCGVSTVGCASFFPSKPLGCYGDGGAILTDDDTLATAMREIRVHGQERRYYHTRVGVGGRMDTLQCAIVLAKLERFDWELNQRHQAGEYYLELLKSVPQVTAPTVRPDRNSAWAQFTVQINDRDAVAVNLKEAGIPTAVHYPIPMHIQPAYRDVSRIVGDLAHTEIAAKRVLSLPMHPYIERETQEKVINALAQSLT